MTLTGRIARGLSWTGAAHATDYLVTVGSLSLLARLLTPADFGTQAAAATVVGIALMVGDLGLGAALIQAPALRGPDLRRASALCACAGLAFGGLTFALSASIGRLFQGGEAVCALLRVLALCALLHPPGAVPRALMTRRMDFRRLALVDAASALASGGVAVALALHGAGAFSLAWGYAVRVALSSGLAWAVVPRRALAPEGSDTGRDRRQGGGEAPLPSPGAEGYACVTPSLSPKVGEREEGGGSRPQRERQVGWNGVEEGDSPPPGLLRFGLNATGAGLLNYLSASVDYLFVGRALGPAALGFYYLAYQLVSLAHFRVVSVLLRVLHPALASVQNDLERLRRGYLRAVRGIALFAFPALALLCALSREVVAVFYGPGKEPAVALASILCGMGLAKSVGGAVGPVFLARGRADIALLWNLFALAVTTVAVGTGLLFGVEGVALAVSLNALLLLAVSEGILHHLLPLTFRAYLAALAPALLAAVAAGGVTGCGMTFLRAALSPFPALIAGSALGGAVYLVLIYALDRKALSEAGELLRAWRGRDGAEEKA